MPQGVPCVIRYCYLGGDIKDLSITQAFAAVFAVSVSGVKCFKNMLFEKKYRSV